jgi:drug/metabolite transporter (DMT)-like permease
MKRSLKAHVLLVLATLVWGATFVLIKNALSDISPLLFNAVRMLLAAVSLLLIFRKDMRRISVETLRAGALVGVLLCLGFELQTTGLKLTTPSKSAFLTGMSVVLVPVFLAVGWRRRVNHWTAIGVAVAVTGLYLLTVPGGKEAGINLAGINRGDVLTLGCAVVFALQIIFLGRATSKHPFQQIATLQVAVCAVFMLAPLPLETMFARWSAAVIAAIIITGLLNTAAAFSIQAWAQQFTPPTHTALIFSLEPVFAWITSYVVSGERLGWRAGWGAVLILTGVLVSELLGSESVEQEVG